MAKNLKRVNVTSSWTDLVGVSGLSGIAGATCLIQNQSSALVRVVFSDVGTNPADADGDFQLAAPGQSISGTAAHVFVRTNGDAGVISVGLTD